MLSEGGRTFRVAGAAFRLRARFSGRVRRWIRMAGLGIVGFGVAQRAFRVEVMWN